MLQLSIDSNLELREISQIEAPRFFHLVDDEREYLNRFLPWPDGVTSISQSATYIEHCSLLIKKKYGCLLGIYLDKNLIGMCGFNIIHPKPQVAELGYWIAQDYQGLGIMRKCVGRMLRYGFEELNLNKIELSCALANKRSQNIALHFKFKLEGKRRAAEVLNGAFIDHFKYGLLKAEY
jgi:ribosomal-protein-serine acetyltransferase